MYNQFDPTICSTKGSRFSISTG
uniref:Uncharacterized protein n=1 Tax=Arundo donax TaxID=35708 RepID=A0A0A9EQR2_ARUDO